MVGQDFQDHMDTLFSRFPEETEKKESGISGRPLYSPSKRHIPRGRLSGWQGGQTRIDAQSQESHAGAGVQIDWLLERCDGKVVDVTAIGML